MSSSDHELVDLKVTAPSGTEILVIDHSLNVIARGLGTVKQQVPPGLYKITFRAGTGVIDTYEEIPSGALTALVEAPTLTFTSSAPLVNSSSTHENHEGAAARLSRQVHAEKGTGSEIFLFARSPNRRVAPVASPAAGLELRTLEGAVLVDVGSEAETDVAVEDPWAGLTVRVDPGPYILRSTTVWGPLEQIVVASPGWQTQVFLVQKQTEPSRSDWGRSPEDDDLDVVNATILQAKLGQGFDWESDNARLAELARVALANDRAVLSEEILREMLTGKFADPMLGILGAHALLRTGGWDPARLETILHNLRELLGVHPDVEALAIAVPDTAPNPQTTFSSPPMLSTSWERIVTKSSSDSDLVPIGSLSARVSTHLWGTGAWLVWQGDALENDLNDSGSAEAIDAILGTLTSFAPVLLSGGRADDQPLSDSEGTLLAWLADMTQPPSPFAAVADPGADVFALPKGTASGIELDAPSVTALANALQLPPASIETLASNLASRLEEAGVIEFPPSS